MNQVEDRLSGLDNKGEELGQINKEWGVQQRQETSRKWGTP